MPPLRGSTRTQLSPQQRTHPSPQLDFAPGEDQTADDENECTVAEVFQESLVLSTVIKDCSCTHNNRVQIRVARRNNVIQCNADRMPEAISIVEQKRNKTGQKCRQHRNGA